MDKNTSLELGFLVLFVVTLLLLTELLGNTWVAFTLWAILIMILRIGLYRYRKAKRLKDHLDNKPKTWTDWF